MNLGPVGSAKLLPRRSWPFGWSGCAGRVAQEFGDHPEAAVARMRWARMVTTEAFAEPVPGPGARADRGRLLAADPKLPGERASGGPSAARRGLGGVCAGRAVLMEEEMIQAQAMAVRLACVRLTAWNLEALQDSVKWACCLAARSQWDRKAAAHAEIFGLLAEVADDPELAPVPRGGVGCVRELLMAVAGRRTG